MEKLDYGRLGFKCGIEIHQQLETHKLFCNCPSLVNDPNKPDIVFKRWLRAVAGETGEVDAAAKHEMKKEKYYLYEGCSTSSCLVEMDEEPPHEVNKGALQIVLQVSKMLNCNIVDEIQFMRKTVVDGSNTSGFQRTALVGYNGLIETPKGKVGVTNVCLEEEASKKVKTEKDHIIYRLDRLGVPLIEIGTDASIKDAEHAKEVASKIGMILRSTGKVKRGIGSIRQDVNVSIKGHSRVEIKGFQELKSMPKVIETEVRRQIALKKKEEPNVRKFEANGTTTFLRPMPGAARMYPETDVAPIIVKDFKFEDVELIDDRVERFEKLGLGHDLAKNIAKSEKYEWFENFVKKFKDIKPAFIASTLVESTKEIKRKFSPDIDKLTDKEFEQIFSYLNEGKISKDVVMDVLIDYSKGQFSLDKYATASDEDMEKEIAEIVKQKPCLNPGAYMGIVMGKFKGKIGGKKAMEILKKYV
ncbi:MAG: Glu-tRNA(Gln) amidotransferase subunit GatE [Nanoarchaeota archaeon]|nr:Glu-tRNA(Gln) amidotransferase subunit GatE [Nanoarchaeota archaeon]